jgi:hypothetical protein
MQSHAAAAAAARGNFLPNFGGGRWNYPAHKSPLPRSLSLSLSFSLSLSLSFSLPSHFDVRPNEELIRDWKEDFFKNFCQWWKGDMTFLQAPYQLDRLSLYLYTVYNILSYNYVCGKLIFCLSTRLTYTFVFGTCRSLTDKYIDR